jgi:phage terminase small subunit
MPHDLTPKQQRFVQEYLIDLNATQAALRAGYSERTAKSIGQENLTKPAVKTAIQQAMQDRSKRTEITQDDVLQLWWSVATADPNELIQYRRTCCRHCHGEGHAFQWLDEDEFLKAVRHATETEGAILPTDEGGYGFDPRLDPVRTCPKCSGEGHGGVFASDTRKLTGGAKLLYDGVKVTVGGFEVKMQDRAKALENVARHLGMFKDRVEVTGKDGGPIVTKQQRDAAVAAALAADT